MEKLLILLVVVLGIVAIGQYMRVYQLAAAARGKREEDISQGDNKFNANMMVIFMVGFYALFIWLLAKYGNGGLPEAATEHGKETDWLLNINWLIIISVFFLTQTLLFVFAWKYYYRPDRKALFYPHNNKLELIWTVIPSAVLAVVIILGLKTWISIMFPGDGNGVTEIEVYSEQFGWTARYGGEDNKLGRADYKLKTGLNPLGVVTSQTIADRIAGIDEEVAMLNERLEKEILPDWQVSELESKISRLQRIKNRIMDLAQVIKADETNWDEVAADDVVTKEVHLIVGQEYEFVFRSQDVIHSAYVPHFRLQMNTVPGQKTVFRFKPTITTAEMRQKTNNPEFDYILLCNKICGAGHNAMSMKIVVQTEEEFRQWMDEQTRFDGDPVKEKPATEVEAGNVEEVQNQESVDSVATVEGENISGN
jgi:cytochrome c oxidase subunit II